MENEQLRLKLLKLIREESIEDVLTVLAGVLDDEANETNFEEQRISLRRVCGAVLEAASIADEESV